MASFPNDDEVSTRRRYRLECLCDEVRAAVDKDDNDLLDLFEPLFAERTEQKLP